MAVCDRGAATAARSPADQRGGIGGRGGAGLNPDHLLERVGDRPVAIDGGACWPAVRSITATSGQRGASRAAPRGGARQRQSQVCGVHGRAASRLGQQVHLRLLSIPDPGGMLISPARGGPAGQGPSPNHTTTPGDCAGSSALAGVVTRPVDRHSLAAAPRQAQPLGILNRSCRLLDEKVSVALARKR
jgi:hypothetical protein